MTGKSSMEELNEYRFFNLGKIDELSAIINLYKDDPAGGMRNKIWSWIITNFIPREEVIKALSEIDAKIDKLVGGK
jgi:hypothetical protein